jgi:hypothetical protein
MMGWAVDAETAIFSRGKKSADGIRPMAGRAVRCCPKFHPAALQ